MITALIVESDEKWREDYKETIEGINNNFKTNTLSSYNEAILSLDSEKYDFYILNDNSVDNNDPEKSEAISLAKLVESKGSEFGRTIITRKRDPNDDKILDEAKRLGIATYTKNSKWAEDLEKYNFNAEIHGHMYLPEASALMLVIIDAALSGAPFIHYTK